MHKTFELYSSISEKHVIASYSLKYLQKSYGFDVAFLEGGDERFIFIYCEVIHVNIGSVVKDCISQRNFGPHQLFSGMCDCLWKWFIEIKLLVSKLQYL